MQKSLLAATTLALFLTTGTAWAATGHYVQKGDTLWILATKYGTTVEAIKKSNNLNSDLIYPGQKLIIPTGQASTYTVQKGDSLFLIGKKYGLTATQLMQANQLTTTTIYPGQKLIIPQRSSQATVARSGIKAGELVDWSEAKKIFALYAKATITDLETGLSFKVQQRGGSSHADVQPLTKADTATMKKIYGGEWSWNRRAIIVNVAGRRLAASMNGMPHGDGAIKDNDFPGHFCIHFQNSKTHGSKKVDPAHQEAVKRAAGLL